MCLSECSPIVNQKILVNEVNLILDDCVVIGKFAYEKRDFSTYGECLHW